MKKYCRYCAFCICGDCYYCTAKEKVLMRVNVVTKCKEFVLSELGDVDSGRKYQPREKKLDFSENVEQLSLL